MVHMAFSRLISAALCLASATALAQEPPSIKNKTDPDLSFKLIAKTDTYKAPAAWRGGKLKERIAVDDFPKPPAVELELQITNKGKEAKSLRLDSDAGKLELDLQGPSALNTAALKVFTREFRTGKVVTIKPGETHTIAWKQLSYGFRGQAMAAYWTEPGDYTLGARLILPLDHADLSKPEKLELSAEPIKLKVEAE
jgi:hypothetical protein